jgi:uncharacterized protein (TIGR02118 family)
MLKLTFCLRRLPGISRQEFQRYWLENHGPLVRKHAAALNIRRYVQLHTLEAALNQAIRGTRGSPEAYDGVAELWFDSEESLAQGTATEAGREAGRLLLEDEQRFIDLERSPLFFGEEKNLVGG